MAEVKKLVPKRRFKEFQNAEAWEECKLGDFVDKAVDNRGKTPPLDVNGKHPLIEVASLGGCSPDYTKIVKYLNDFSFENNLRDYIKKRDILFSTVGSIGLVSMMDNNEHAAIAQNIVAFRAKENYVPEYLYSLFSTEGNKDKAYRIVMGAVQPSIKVSQLVNVEYSVTKDKKEQEKIGSHFKNLDNLITLHQRKLDKIKSMKKAYLSEMFPAEGERKPKRRFKGFTDDWELRKLGDVVDLCSGRDYKHLSKGNIPVYGTGGYMLSVKDALSYDKDAIGIGRKGTIDKPYILKSPFWTVDTLFYAIPRAKHNLDFLYGIFQNIDWKQKDESSGVPSLSKVAINNTNVLAPEISEQKKIGKLLIDIDNLITLHQQKLDKLKNLKKSYLNEMFI